MANNLPVNYTELFDFVMADHLTMRAFMLSVSVELARTHEDDPIRWMSEFISTLHARVDVNEASLGPGASRLPIHEMARKKIDSLGQDIEKILRSPSGER